MLRKLSMTNLWMGKLMERCFKLTRYLIF